MSAPVSPWTLEVVRAAEQGHPAKRRSSLIRFGTIRKVG